MTHKTPKHNQIDKFASNSKTQKNLLKKRPFGLVITLANIKFKCHKISSA